MPQPAKTLPDPLKAVAAESGPNADEILSQLAGEEIDRLLAEADAPRAQTAAPAVAPRSVDPAPTPAKPPVPDPAVDPDLNRQLDDLFNELNQEAPAVPEMLAPPAPPAPAGQLPVAAKTQTVAPAPEETAQEPEQDVPAASEMEFPGLAPIGDLPAEPLPAEAPPPVEPADSPFLRPLVWLSNLFSETVLDWLGKIAILTTVNAMLIFAYILLRRH
jgi:hypothetical protein